MPQRRWTIVILVAAVLAVTVLQLCSVRAPSSTGVVVRSASARAAPLTRPNRRSGVNATSTSTRVTPTARSLQRTRRSDGGPAVAHTLLSPSATHALEFSLVDGVPRYRVFAGDTPVLDASRLALHVDGGAFAGKLTVLDIERRNATARRWQPVAGSMHSYPDAHRELVVRLREASDEKRHIDLTFRAYDEGVAFRYSFPAQRGLGELVLRAENTEFQLPAGDHHAHWADYPQARYSRVPLSKMGNNAVRPLLLETGARYIALAEAGSIEQYAPMSLSRNGDNRLVSVFRRAPVVLSCPASTPWRVVMVADEPGTLVERHYLLQNLSPPCALDDTSWIRPGKVWRSALTTAAATAIVDYATLHNYQYVHYDAGWYGPEQSAKSNPTTPIKAIDLKRVIAYARERGVGLICYINRIAMAQYDLNHTLGTYAAWGIKGVKFGFVDWQSQAHMQFLHRAIRTAAHHKLVVDIHDNFRLTGIERTYPHVLTVEGILGNEATPAKGNTPKNVLTTAFARMIAGAADFTPCYLDKRVVSRAFQLALPVVFFSPLQYLHWYDQVGEYAENVYAPELEFWSALPTTWHDTKVLHGRVGEYISVARRRGHAWFVGSLSAEARRIEIPLRFLALSTTSSAPAAYTARVFREGEREQRRVRVDVLSVNASSTVVATLGRGGGHAMWIAPALGD